jgi:arylsulfatase A-like enzyme
MVYRMDLGIGRIMKTLKEKGIDRNTFVIFASDNGRTFGYGDWLAENHPFSGHKSEMLDGGIRVPFLVWSAELAKSAQSGKVYDGLVSLADIAPTLMAQASDAPYAHPTDGVDLMPYLSGKEAPLEGRTWFCALKASPEKMTGIEDFTDPEFDAGLVHLAYVRDDQKLLCWIPQDDHRPGASYARLPRVVGKNNPAELLRERTPVAGTVPVEGTGRALYEEMVDLIRSNGDALVPVWSGDVGKKPLPVSWMSFEK